MSTCHESSEAKAARLLPGSVPHGVHVSKSTQISQEELEFLSAVLVKRSST